jgi:hypothetical protein
MRHHIFRVAVALLALTAGVFAQAVWESRRQTIDACAEFVRDWQD